MILPRQLEVGLVETDETGAGGTQLPDRVGRDLLARGIIWRTEPDQSRSPRLGDDCCEVEAQRRSGEGIDEVECGSRHAHAGGVQLIGGASDDGAIATAEREPGTEQDRLIGTRSRHDARWIYTHVARNCALEWGIVGFGVGTDRSVSNLLRDARPPGRIEWQRVHVKARHAPFGHALLPAVR